MNNIVEDLKSLNIDTTKLNNVKVTTDNGKDSGVSMTDKQSIECTKKSGEITPFEDIKLQLMIKQTKLLQSIKYMILILFIIVIIIVTYTMLKGFYYGFTDALLGR